MTFSFQSSTQIHFGEGIAKNLTQFLPEQCKRVCVLTGKSSQRHASVLNALKRAGLEVQLEKVAGEPTLSTVEACAQRLRDFEPDCAIAIGGGSVLDTGKAVAALAPCSNPLRDFLEGLGGGKSLSAPGIPFMAVPTTAGTGSEVTRNSVIGVPDSGVKVSLRSDYLQPRWAVVDPELTYQLPLEVAAYTGMDALIQCLEAYLSQQAPPLTDGLAREGLKRAARSLRAACSVHLDPVAKADLCAASLCSGLALANAKLGSIHGFAGAIGGMIDAPHGAICASLLVPCFKMNAKALASRDPKHPSVSKMDDIAAVLTGNPQAKATYALAWFDSIFGELPLQRLGDLGLAESQLEEAAKKAATSSSMKGNPVALSKFELIEILEEAL